MSRIYELSIASDYTIPRIAIKNIAIKPRADTFDSFLAEIFTRFPLINRQKLELYYVDHNREKISIIISEDFDIFKHQRIDHVVAVIDDYNALSFRVMTTSRTTPTTPSHQTGSIPTTASHQTGSTPTTASHQTGSTPTISSQTSGVGSVPVKGKSAEMPKLRARNSSDASTSDSPTTPREKRQRTDNSERRYSSRQ